MKLIDNKDVGTRLRSLLTHLGLNSRKFAYSINADPAYISRMISGQKPVSNNYQERISRIHGVNLKWLMLGEGDMFVQNVHHSGNKDGQNLSGTEQERSDNTGSDLLAQIMHRQNELLETQNRILSEQRDSLFNKLTALEAHIAQIEKRVSRVDANSDLIFSGLKVVELQLHSVRQVSLESLSRLEKKPESALLQEADKIMMLKVEQTQGMLSEVDKTGKY